MAAPLSPTPAPAFGRLPAPMFDARCRCLDVVEEGRGRIATMAASTGRVTDKARAAIAMSRGIGWEGNASLLFRDRLDGLRGELDAHDTASAAVTRMT